MMRKSYDQLTSGFEPCLNWHQDLHSKLLCLERRKELFYYSIVIIGAKTFNNSTPFSPSAALKYFSYLQDKTRQDNALFGVLYSHIYIDFLSK